MSGYLLEHIEAFLEALAAEKGYSMHTLRAYRQNLMEFAAYVAGHPEWAVNGLAQVAAKAFLKQVFENPNDWRRLNRSASIPSRSVLIWAICIKEIKRRPLPASCRLFVHFSGICTNTGSLLRIRPRRCVRPNTASPSRRICLLTMSSA